MRSFVKKRIVMKFIRTLMRMGIGSEPMSVDKYAIWLMEIDSYVDEFTWRGRDDR